MAEALPLNVLLSRQRDYPIHVAHESRLGPVSSSPSIRVATALRFLNAAGMGSLLAVICQSLPTATKQKPAIGDLGHWCQNLHATLS